MRLEITDTEKVGADGGCATLSTERGERLNFENFGSGKHHVERLRWYEHTLMMDEANTVNHTIITEMRGTRAKEDEY